MLSGDMPTQLGRMKGLQVLSFALNDLSGPIPSEIGQMQSLSRLLLQNNSFVGSIPSEMGNLGNLGKCRDVLVLVRWSSFGASLKAKCFRCSHNGSVRK